ncbi:hypothetical protein SLE2022_153130 [Rubroshorea leprosula]
MARKRKRPETKSSKPPACLPLDIIYEILLISPAKAVGRFRCLSKSLYSFLTDSQFIHRHTLQASEKGEDHRLVPTFLPHLYVINLETAALVPRKSILAKEVVQSFQPCWDCRFLGSCNGLLCHYRCPDKFLVSNPLTREYCQVWVHGFGLGKNPSIVLGFGFDHSSKDYKILRGWLSSRGWETQVFSVKNNCWKFVGVQESSALPKTTVVNLPVVSLHGVIHWDANQESNFKSIASFDFVKEELRDIMLPPSDRDQNLVVPSCISALRGRLCMSRQCLQTQNRTDVWIMEEYGVPESWTKQLSIELRWNVRDHWVPICHSKNDRIIFQNKKKRRLVVYNPKDKKFIKRLFPKCLPHDYPYFWMATYVETLVSIKN